METEWLKSRIEDESIRLEMAEKERERLESQKGELQDVEKMVEGDEELQIAIARVEKEIQEKERMAEEEVESAYLAFVDFQDQLKRVMEQNKESLENIQRLREAGIDVSEAESLLKERQVILHECEVRLGNIAERLNATRTNAGPFEDLSNRFHEYYKTEMEILSHSIRQSRKPSEITESGELRGAWEGDSFVLNHHYVPTSKFNPEGKTIAEIADDLKSDYDIELGPIPFHGDEADFSRIAVASVDTGEVTRWREETNLEMMLAYGVSSKQELLENLQDTAEMFQNRSRNMHAADVILAEKHVFIPTLGDKYTASQLADWRRDHRFTWDEQLGGGYLLVPSVIHSCIGHTGLVSKTKNAATAYEVYLKNK